MASLPFRGGVVPDCTGSYPAYANGKNAWRCSACGKVGPWMPSSGGYWSLLDEENTGIIADARPGGWPYWCSPECQGKVVASGATTELVVRTSPKRRRP